MRLLLLLLGFVCAVSHWITQAARNEDDGGVGGGGGVDDDGDGEEEVQAEQAECQRARNNVAACAQSSGRRRGVQLSGGEAAPETVRVARGFIPQKPDSLPCSYPSRGVEIFFPPLALLGTRGKNFGFWFCSYPHLVPPDSGDLATLSRRRILVCCRPGGINAPTSYRVVKAKASNLNLQRLKNNRIEQEGGGQKKNCLFSLINQNRFLHNSCIST